MTNILAAVVLTLATNWNEIAVLQDVRGNRYSIHEGRVSTNGSAVVLGREVTVYGPVAFVLPDQRCVQTSQGPGGTGERVRFRFDLPVKIVGLTRSGAPILTNLPPPLPDAVDPRKNAREKE